MRLTPAPGYTGSTGSVGFFLHAHHTELEPVSLGFFRAHEIDFTTRAGGHSWEYFDHMAERVERFIFAALEYESRRLL